MRALIVEDEEIVAKRLARFVSSILGERSVVRLAGSLDDATDLLATFRIDLLFLDLDLHGREGFLLLERAVAGSFQTIVVSARADQALRAFEYGVADFVAKPFTEERLRKAIDRVQSREPELREKLKVLSVHKGGQLHLVPLERVVAVGGAGDYSRILCDDGRSWLHDKTLSALEVLLPARFERVHRSWIVDLGRVERIVTEPGSRHRLVLAGGEQIPASRSRIAAVRQRLL